MSEKVLITPTTAAEVSEEFSLNYDHLGFLTSFGLKNTEAVTIQIKCPASKTWDDYKAKGNLFQLAEDTNGLDIYKSAGTYRVIKTATASAVGVGLTTSKVEI